MTTPEVNAAAVAELDPVTLYQILRLRTDVFVVEQNCAYPELDGRDLEPGTRLLWVERDGEILATLRVLREPDGSARIGRVATAKQARSDGLAGLLMSYAIADLGPVPIVLDAQSYLEKWYARFGFVTSGEEYLDDGIPHVPMRRAAAGPATPEG